MNIDINTKMMAVIGDPIGHSLSPLMHNTIIEANGFNAVYLPFHVKSDELREYVDSMRTLKFAGFNATMPHKQALLSLVDEIDEEARRYQSVNTVKIRNGKLTGYNTDVRGLFQAFSDRGAVLEGSRVMIIGAGGVAGSLIKGAAGQKIGHITVLNRTKEKAENLCRGLDYAEAVAQTSENMKEAAGKADIIINCTSLGMSGTASDFTDLSFLDNTSALLCDLIYNPWETKFLAYGRKLGLDTMNGMSMLIYQGLLAFEIFMDVKLDYAEEYDRVYSVCRDRLLKNPDIVSSKNDVQTNIL